MSSTDQTATAKRSNSSLNAPDTNNATWFDYTEETNGSWDSETDWYCTNRYLYYKHLAEINRGRKRGQNYWNDPYHTYQTNRDLIKIVASQLELLPRQQGEAKAWFTHFDLNEWGMRAELVACCLCARVVHEDDDDERRTHPSVSHEEKPIEFAEMAERFCLREIDVTSMYGKIDSYLRRNSEPTTREFDRRGGDEGDEYRQVTAGDRSR